MMLIFFFFFFNDTATTEIYTLSLHDALPIFPRLFPQGGVPFPHAAPRCAWRFLSNRSEEHTSELQSQSNLVCRLLLEKKKKQYQKSPLQIQHDFSCKIVVAYLLPVQYNTTAR